MGWIKAFLASSCHSWSPERKIFNTVQIGIWNIDREQRTGKTTNITHWEILKIQGKPLLHVIQLNPWTLEFLIFVFARWIRILFSKYVKSWHELRRRGSYANWQEQQSDNRRQKRGLGLRDAINKSSFGRLAQLKLAIFTSCTTLLEYSPTHILLYSVS